MPGGIPDQVAAVPGLGQGKAGLAPPHPGQAGRVRAGVVPADFLRQRQQVSFPVGSARSVQQLVGEAGGSQSTVSTRPSR